jgi:hypothetical protein
MNHAHERRTTRSKLHRAFRTQQITDLASARATTETIDVEPLRAASDRGRVEP